MTLPDERVLEKLERDFVVGWRSIEREDYCGHSSGYRRDQTAVGTTNGAGGHNVQLFVLSPDLVVLHALPGFWHPDDLIAELDFARAMFRLWRDDSRTRAQKETMFARLHDVEMRRQSPETTARSTWQSFDRHHEARRLHKQSRDTGYVDEAGVVHVVPLNILVHRRMAAQPFVPFDEFDVSSFVDYGRLHYDNNVSHDRGRTFGALKRLMAKRDRETYKARMREEQERRKAARRRS